MSAPVYSTDELNQYALREIFSRINMEHTHRLLGVKSEALDAPDNMPAGCVASCESPATGAFLYIPNVYRGV